MCVCVYIYIYITTKRYQEEVLCYELTSNQLSIINNLFHCIDSTLFFEYKIE